MKPIPGDRPGADHRAPADRRPQPPVAELGDQPRAAGRAQRLAHQVADQDAERDRRGVGAGQEPAVQHDPRVGQREQRHDDVAGPRVEDLREPVVRRDRGAHHPLRRGRQLGGGLLAEQPEGLGRLLQGGPGRRVGVGQQPHDQAHHDRIHTRLEERHPGRDPDEQVGGPVLDAARPDDQDHREESDPEQQRHHLDASAVRDRDDGDPGQVVDDGEGEQVGADAIGQPAADQGERAEREGGVGRHRHAPAVLGRPSGVEDQVDADGHDHAAQPGQERQRDPAPHPQLAHVELTPRLQPDDQEEQRHQPGVHELAQVDDHARAADQEGKLRRPELVVGRDADVRPDQGGHGGTRQDRGAARLGTQERAQRRLHAPRPGSPPGKRPPRLLTVLRLLSSLSLSFINSSLVSTNNPISTEGLTRINSLTRRFAHCSLTGSISRVAISIVIPPSAGSLITSNMSAPGSGPSVLVTLVEHHKPRPHGPRPDNRDPRRCPPHRRSG